MLMTATLIGVGAFLLFRDLPASTREFAGQASWIPHIVIFALLFYLHGGSAEGAAMAGVATLIFRWLMPLGAPRSKSSSAGSTREKLGKILAP